MDSIIANGKIPTIERNQIEETIKVGDIMSLVKVLESCYNRSTLTTTKKILSKMVI